MRNMMSQVRNWSKLSIILAVLLLAAGCKNSDPFVDPGDTPDPHWVVTVENDMTASMTGVVRVSFAPNEGTLAAFMGEECCGVADYIDGLYHLYLSPANETTDVQLRFYSPDQKRIFDATSTFPFRNDIQLGTVANPHTPSWTVAK